MTLYRAGSEGSGEVSSPLRQQGRETSYSPEISGASRSSFTFIKSSQTYSRRRCLFPHAVDRLKCKRNAEVQRTTSLELSTALASFDDNSPQVSPENLDDSDQLMKRTKPELLLLPSQCSHQCEAQKRIEERRRSLELAASLPLIDSILHWMAVCQSTLVHLSSLQPTLSMKRLMECVGVDPLTVLYSEEDESFVAE